MTCRVCGAGCTATPQHGELLVDALWLSHKWMLRDYRLSAHGMLWNAYLRNQQPTFLLRGIMCPVFPSYSSINHGLFEVFSFSLLQCCMLVRSLSKSHTNPLWEGGQGDSENSCDAATVCYPLMTTLWARSTNSSWRFQDQLPIIDQPNLATTNVNGWSPTHRVRTHRVLREVLEMAEPLWRRRSLRCSAWQGRPCVARSGRSWFLLAVEIACEAAQFVGVLKGGSCT